MADKAHTPDDKPADETPAPAAPPKRSPGHRGADVRDTVAEMAARAQEISQEAGSKMAGAMKDVINAAAGLAGFAIESARDLVQYMVRRGQMSQEEADKLLRDAEEAQARRKPATSATTEAPIPASVGAPPIEARPAAKKVPKAPAPAAAESRATEPKAPAKKAAAKSAKPAEAARAKVPAAKSAAKAPAKGAAKGAAKKAPAKKK
jgi:polyhydroxyalkanoate synthesis regulator phasin